MEKEEEVEEEEEEEEEKKKKELEKKQEAQKEKHENNETLTCCFSKLITTYERKIQEKIARNFKEFPNCARAFKIIIFEVSFLVILLGICGVFGFVFSLTVDSFNPRNNLAIATQGPGLGFRPRPQEVKSTLIEFVHGGAGDWKQLTRSLSGWYGTYSHGKNPGGMVTCSWSYVQNKHDRCHVSRRKLIDWSYHSRCTKADNYGYYHGRPCVLLKVNKVVGWEPQPYYNLTEIQLLEQMPDTLKENIRNTWEKNCRGKGDEKEKKCPNLRMIWVSCEGVTSADKEYAGPIKVYKMHGFPGFYYPYWNQQNYLSPMVWLQFRQLTPGVVVSIQCKLWAKNIKHDTRSPTKGGVQFEILMK